MQSFQNISHSKKHWAIYYRSSV